MNSSDNNIMLRSGDGHKLHGVQSMPLVLILDRLRSAFNVGNIFRLADATTVPLIVTCGYTATPPHPKLAKTARGCDQIVSAVHAETAVEAVLAYKDKGYRTYAVETVATATPIWDVKFTFPAVVVLGNEALGISPDALQQCEEYIQLPSLGFKNSINVANCAAVVLYKALGQWCCRAGSEMS